MITELYDWQKKIISHEGNLTIKGARQVGKSEAVAERIVYLAKKYPGCRILITSPSERQESYLYEKVIRIFGEKQKYRKRLTLKELFLPNGTNIYKYPVGKTGMFVEGMSSIDFLFIDEAIGMTERAMDALLPMLAEPRSRGLGWVTMLGNTRGKPVGAFYDSFKEGSGYEKITISGEDCPHISKEFLSQEKIRLGENRYKMIWLGEFVLEEYNYFQIETINVAMNFEFWKLNKDYNSYAKYFLGIDPGRLGKDPSAFVIVELFNDFLKIVHCEVTTKCTLIETANMAEYLHAKFKFSKIYVDDGGVGAGLVDILEERIPRKIRPLNSASKSEEGNRILKEDLFSNLKRLLEQKKITIINDDRIRKSLISITYEDDERGPKIEGKDDHLADAAVRACWCIKEKHFKLKIHSF